MSSILLFFITQGNWLIHWFDRAEPLQGNERPLSGKNLPNIFVVVLDSINWNELNIQKDFFGKNLNQFLKTSTQPKLVITPLPMTHGSFHSLFTSKLPY
ncbi:MAG: hypothetical protein ACK5P5_03995, partial [Pseudobdellovibrionaceae bacterium]